MVASPGRLIVSVYGQGTWATPEVAVKTLQGLGFKASGATACVSATVAWIDKPTAAWVPVDVAGTRAGRADQGDRATRTSVHDLFRVSAERRMVWALLLEIAWRIRFRQVCAG